MEWSKETIDREIRDILDKRSYYGTVDITEKHIGSVTWVGSVGLTASVGQWIRVISREMKGIEWLKNPISRRYIIPEEHGNFYCFSVEFDGSEFVCGGCTDFSGEGSRGKAIAERYQEFLKFPIEERGAFDLIMRLTE